MMKTIIVFLFFSLNCISLFSQSSVHEVMATSGNSYQTNSIQIDWTLGEVAISTLTGSGSLLTQGFHQPHYLITAINRLPADYGQIKVYPNPTTDQLNIDFAFTKKEKIELVLLDLTGKVMLKNTIVGQTISKNISLATLPSGTYFLSMKIGNQIFSQTHKIQKVN